MILDTSVGITMREFDAHDEHHEEEHHDDHEYEDHGEDKDTDEHHNKDEHTDEHHEDGEHDDHHHTGTDPHIWLSVSNTQQQADTITDALTDADPSQMMVYMAHNADYQTKLTILDQEIRAMLVSADVQPFVVFHDAYAYYLHEYGIADQQVDMVLEHHNDTLTQGEVAEIIQHIQEYNVATLFIEPQFSPDTVEALQQETGVAIREIDPIGTQMDADGYLATMRAITEAFIQ
jgi:zinc transport system substrate-binding protein